MRLPYPLHKFLLSIGALRDEMREMQKSVHEDSVCLSDSVNNLKDSIAAHWETDQERRKANPPIATTTLRTDVPITVETKPKRSTIEKLWLAIKGTLEVMGILAVIAYTFVSYNNWQDQADATNSAARQTELSRKALNETAKNFRVGQRAWVGAEVFVVAPQSNQPPRSAIPFKVVYKNTGLTPALGLHITLGAMYKDRQYLMESDFQEKPTYLNEKSGQHHTHQFLMPNGGAGETPAVTIPSPKPGSHLFILGSLHYIDIFGHPHETNFCSRIDESNPLMCNIHNTMN